MWRKKHRKNKLDSTFNVHFGVQKITKDRVRICTPFKEPRIPQESISSLSGRYDNPICRTWPPEPVFVKVYGAQESIPRNRFRQPM